MSPTISRVESSPAELLRPLRSEDQDIISPDALSFLAALGHRFAERAQWLASAREERARRLADGTESLRFPTTTADIREGDWHVLPPPDDLGPGESILAEPTDRGAMIDALSAGDGLAVADFEDSTSPTWANIVEGQRTLRAAVRKSLHADALTNGRQRATGPQATLVVRPRGWERMERHVLVDERTMSAPLVDAGLFLFHNAHALKHHQSGPYFSLPRLEGGSEAALWEDVLSFAEEWLDLPHGTARVTIIAESVGAVFELDEVLYALRDRVCGVSMGRWNYLVSFIRTRANDPRAVLPDRSQLGMTQPALRAYAQRVVQVCHRRGAWTDGFEGRDEEDGPLVTAQQLLVTPTGSRTEAGLRFNVRVALRYLEAWLRGRGRVALYGVREDASAAELSSAQVWQWVRHGATLDDGRAITRDLVYAVVTEEMRVIAGEVGKATFVKGRFIEARTLFLSVATAEELPELVTVAGYPLLTGQ